MSMILLKLGAIEILFSAQYVCSSWRKLFQDPIMWRVIDMHNLGDLHALNYNLKTICRHSIDRSCGQLMDINIEYFGNDKLLQYIGRRTNQLKRLRIVICHDISNRGLATAVSNFPLLEQLEIFLCSFSVKALRTVGRCCPLLKMLKWNRQFRRGRGMVSDKEAFAIAETMPELRHLQIFGNALTDKGLKAILDGCPHLESLDLRQCFNLRLAGQLGKICAENIEILHLPRDPTNDYKFITNIIDFDEDDFEDYPSDFFDNNDDDDDEDDNDDYSHGDHNYGDRPMEYTICYPREENFSSP